MGELRERLLAVLDARPARRGRGPVAPAAPGDTQGASPYLERIAVEMRGKVRVVPVSQIEYITASGPYVELHTSERAYLIREAIQTLETPPRSESISSHSSLDHRARRSDRHVPSRRGRRLRGPAQERRSAPRESLAPRGARATARRHELVPSQLERGRTVGF